MARDEEMGAAREEANTVPLAINDGGGSLYPEVEEKDICRICLESDAPSDDPLIAPCRCAGSSKWVHRKCLDEWRSQERVPLAFSHCPTCKFQYRTEVSNEEHIVVRRVKLVLFVARDTVGVFIVVQSVIAVLSLLLHACDPNEAIVKLWARLGGDWAETNAASHMAIGPYYVTTCIALLAILGFVTLCLLCTGNLPAQRPEARHPPRWRRPPQQGNQYCAACCSDSQRSDCDCCLYCYVCPDANPCGNVQCSCPDCNGCGDDGAAIVLAVGLALLVIFVLIGLIVGLFFSVIVVQRIIQKRMLLLHMRGEAKVHRVLDLAPTPELLVSPLSSVSYEAPAAPGPSMQSECSEVPKMRE